MSKLIHASICVSDIPKELIKSHTNGKKYLSIDIWINDEEDKYGNDCSLNISQSKEDREAKVKKIYIGNGKTKFGFDKSDESTRKMHGSEVNRQAGVVTAPAGDWEEESVPF